MAVPDGDIKGWIGPFYPKNMEGADHLRHYSTVFDVTEVNSTFYKIPSQSTTQKWFDCTPQNFKFTAKIPSAITHEGRLKPGPYLDQFLNSIRPLESKMTILVIQLPPSLSFTESRTPLEKMINHMPSMYRYAVEGRHPSWFSEESYQFLSERNLCLVWNEVQGVENPAPVTTDFGYLRLIGDRSIPENEFGKIHMDRTELLQKWADRLGVIKNEISVAFAMANNHFEGFAPLLPTSCGS